MVLMNVDDGSPFVTFYIVVNRRVLYTEKNTWSSSPYYEDTRVSVSPVDHVQNEPQQGRSVRGFLNFNALPSDAFT